jgi:hypothetical protein
MVHTLGSPLSSDIYADNASIVSKKGCIPVSVLNIRLTAKPTAPLEKTLDFYLETT